MTVSLRDRAFTNTGTPVVGATVQAILVTGGGTDAGTSSVVQATTTTDVNGVWKFAALADPGAGNWYDVKITNGTQVLWRYGNIQAWLANLNLAQSMTITAGQTWDFTAAALKLPTAASGIANGAVGIGGGLFTWGDGAVQHTAVDLSTGQTLTNKGLTSPSITNPSIAGTVSGGATYTSPTINTPTITSPSTSNPTITGTVAGSATYNTPTLTDPVLGNSTATGVVPYHGTVTQTLPAAASSLGKCRFYKAYGGTLTIQCNGGVSELVGPGINNVTGGVQPSYTLQNGESATFYSDGAQWWAC